MFKNVRLLYQLSSIPVKTQVQFAAVTRYAFKNRLWYPTCPDRFLKILFKCYFTKGVLLVCLPDKHFDRFYFDNCFLTLLEQRIVLLWPTTYLNKRHHTYQIVRVIRVTKVIFLKLVFLHTKHHTHTENLDYDFSKNSRVWNPTFITLHAKLMECIWSKPAIKLLQCMPDMAVSADVC